MDFNHGDRVTVTLGHSVTKLGLRVTRSKNLAFHRVWLHSVSTIGVL